MVRVAAMQIVLLQITANLDLKTHITAKDAQKREISIPSIVTRHKPVELVTSVIITSMTLKIHKPNPKAFVFLAAWHHLSLNAPLKLHTAIPNKLVKNLAQQTKNAKIMAPLLILKRRALITSAMMDAKKIINATGNLIPIIMVPIAVFKTLLPVKLELVTQLTASIFQINTQAPSAPNLTKFVEVKASVSKRLANSTLTAQPLNTATLMKGAVQLALMTLTAKIATTVRPQQDTVRITHAHTPQIVLLTSV
jgi:hypothetical protein